MKHGFPFFTLNTCRVISLREIYMYVPMQGKKWDNTDTVTCNIPETLSLLHGHSIINNSKNCDLMSCGAIPKQTFCNLDYNLNFGGYILLKTSCPYLGIHMVHMAYVSHSCIRMCVSIFMHMYITPVSTHTRVYFHRNIRKAIWKDN